MGVNGIYGLSGSGLDIESMVKAGMLGKQKQLEKMQQTYTKNEWKKEAYLEIYDEINTFNLKTLSDYKKSNNMKARSASSSSDAIKATATSSAAIGTHYITVNNTATNAFLVGNNDKWKDDDLSDDSDPKLNTALKFKINDGKEITVEANKSIYDFISAVNNSGSGVNASYTASAGYISFSNPTAGAGHDIKIEAITEDTAKFFEDLKLRVRTSDNTVATSDTAYLKASAFLKADGADSLAAQATGQDASVIIDGRKVDSKKNNILLDGITYNIGNVTESTTAVITIDSDPEKIIENVKSFVEDYNELVSKIYDAYKETPNSSYTPLTDSQKAEMTSEQIAKWEEKAKTGLLYHEQTLRKIVDDMRSSIISAVGGESAYKLGISTVSTSGMYGQIQLDEDKLTEALNNDADAVYNVFAKPSDDENNNGIAIRLSTALSNATKSIKKVAGTSASTVSDSTLDTLLNSMQQRISNFKKMMTTFENNLYKRYDAMEAALATLGSQMNYVSSMFAS